MNTIGGQTKHYAQYGPSRTGQYLTKQSWLPFGGGKHYIGADADDVMPRLSTRPRYEDFRSTANKSLSFGVATTPVSSQNRARHGRGHQRSKTIGPSPNDFRCTNTGMEISGV